MIFGKSAIEKKAVAAWDSVLETILSQGEAIVADNLLLTAIRKRRPQGEFTFYSAVSGVDIIYLQSIIAFGPGTKEVKKVAKALRSRFESRINEHLMRNLEALHSFQEALESEPPFKDKRLLPMDVHGAWTVMAFDGNRHLDFSDPKVIKASKQVSAWIHQAVGGAF